MTGISVVIPAYNAGATLGDCLAALGHQVDLPAPFEVLVVDDGSRDGTPAVARQAQADLSPAMPMAAPLPLPQVRLLQQPRAGPATARNRGIQAARGQLIFFLDADCVPASDWLAAFFALAKSTHARRPVHAESGSQAHHP